MSFGMTLLNFRNGMRAPIPRDDIVGILTRFGCQVPQLREGFNHVGLPRDEKHISPFGDSALLVVKGGEIMEFGLDRVQATEPCRALLFALVDEIGLTMFPDYGENLFAREDVFREIPQEILSQFSNRIVVSRPEDCAA
jgi:hypothetical protein